jgi:hypothetical protein
MKKAPILVALAVIGAAGWYAFRPERLIVDDTVSEALPATATSSAAGSVEPMAIANGLFHSVAHETKGNATIHRFADGSRILRFTNFETSNGPDVRVYMVAAPDAADNETVTKAGFVELGPMKGNIGDQNYEIPASLDLGKYQTVTIWCKRFGVNFASAPLTRS